MIDLKSIPVPNKSYVIKDIGEDTILISEDENLIHTLDEVGTFVWKQIDGRKSLENILEAECGEFDIDRDKAETDLLAFIDELEDIGLVTLK